ncbi:hypothetical protein Tco_1353981 [Tanacetum coccineum]
MMRVHYNNSLFPWRHVGTFPSDMSLGIAFPSDMSLGNTRWGSFVRDSFPSDNPQRREEMKRLEATGKYTEDEINALARGGKLRGSDSKYSDKFKEFESGGASGSGGCGDDEESGDDEDGDGDD